MHRASSSGAALFLDLCVVCQFGLIQLFCPKQVQELFPALTEKHKIHWVPDQEFAELQICLAPHFVFKIV